MASSPLKSNPQHHVRSISLPSRPHLLTHQVDENLSRLRDSKAISISLSSIGNRVSALEDMFDSLDDFLLLSNNQKALVGNEKWFEEALDGYLRLLDLCATVKDISSKTKEDLQGLLSALRRRRDRNELERYLNSRKKIKKVIQKSLKNLKNLKTKRKDNEKEGIASLFQEVKEASLVVLESLMSYIAGSKPQLKLRVFVNKRILGKTSTMKDDVNVFENIDVALELLLTKKDKLEDITQIEIVKGQLAEMGSSVEDLEQGLECLFRCLIKTRVAILNIINH